jgi:hypothetical protein
MGQPGRTHPLHTPNWDGRRLGPLRSPGEGESPRFRFRVFGRGTTVLPCPTCPTSPSLLPHLGPSCHTVLKPFGGHAHGSFLFCHPSITYHDLFFSCAYISKSISSSSSVIGYTHLTNLRTRFLLFYLACFFFVFVFPLPLKTFSFRGCIYLPLALSFLLALGFLSFYFCRSIYLSIYLYLTCTVNIPSRVLILLWFVRSHPSHSR